MNLGFYGVSYRINSQSKVSFKGNDKDNNVKDLSKYKADKLENLKDKAKKCEMDINPNNHIMVTKELISLTKDLITVCQELNMRQNLMYAQTQYTDPDSWVGG